MPTVLNMVDRLIDDEVRSSGANRVQARGPVARRIGMAPGTLENIQRDRLKFLDRWEAKIRAAFIRVLEQEIAKATHELQIARQRGVGVHSPEVCEAETALRRRMEEAEQVLR